MPLSVLWCPYDERTSDFQMSGKGSVMRDIPDSSRWFCRRRTGQILTIIILVFLSRFRKGP
jgi:hypothetical protein